MLIQTIHFLGMYVCVYECMHVVSPCHGHGTCGDYPVINLGHVVTTLSWTWDMLWWLSCHGLGTCGDYPVINLGHVVTALSWTWDMLWSLPCHGLGTCGDYPVIDLGHVVVTPLSQTWDMLCLLPCSGIMTCAYIPPSGTHDTCLLSCHEPVTSWDYILPCHEPVTCCACSPVTDSRHWCDNPPRLDSRHSVLTTLSWPLYTCLLPSSLLKKKFKFLLFPSSCHGVSIILSK